MAGRDVVTLEGVPEDMRRVLGEAFLLEGAVQCGFCIPGIVIRASGLLQHNRTQDRQEVAKSLDAHLCRCTGYARIVDAIQTAGEAWQDHKQLPSEEPRRHSYFGEDFGLTRTTKNGHKRQWHRPIAVAISGPGAGIGREAFRRRHARSRNAATPRRCSARTRARKFWPSIAAQAQEMPGVERIVTAHDVPGQRGTGLAIPDLPIFVAVGETTCCVGDILALVVADTAFHARQAAERSQSRLRSTRAGDRSVCSHVARCAASACSRAICTCIPTCWTPRHFRAAM